MGECNGCCLRPSPYVHSCQCRPNRIDKWESILNIKRFVAKKRQIEQSQDDGLLEQMLGELDCAQTASKPKRPRVKCGHKYNAREMSYSRERTCEGSVSCCRSAGKRKPPPGSVTKAAQIMPECDASYPATIQEDAAPFTDQDTVMDSLPTCYGDDLKTVHHGTNDCSPSELPLPETETGDDQEANPSSEDKNAREAELAPVQNRMCVLPERSEALPGPASGWQAAVSCAGQPQSRGSDQLHSDDEQAGQGVEAHDEMGEAVHEHQDKAAPSGDSLHFFFIDAVYEPAMVGTVIMVGKMRQNSELVSACVTVKGMRQCLFVVPKPFVFQDPDGDIARCAMQSQ